MPPKTKKKAAKKVKKTVKKKSTAAAPGAKSGKSLNGIPNEKIVSMYKTMVRMRQFEERCYQVYLQRKIGGFCHIYSGQEAVGVGMIDTLSKEDYIITAYRDHGQAIARGMTMRECMAEMYGKATGCSRGKGGSMHFFDNEKHFMGGHAIVGAHIPLATGLAWAIKYQKRKAAVICFFGDGAMNQGVVHEGLSLAGLHRLPVIFVCENNGYAMGTAVARGAAETRIYLRAGSYQINSLRVDGHNIFEVYEKTKEAVERAKESYEPTFIEAMTYRYRGHSMSDPGNYRSKDELEEEKSKDPVVSLGNELLKNRLLTKSDIETIEAEADKEVMDSIDFAENSPEPTIDSMYEDIYVDYPMDHIRKGGL